MASALTVGMTKAAPTPLAGQTAVTPAAQNFTDAVFVQTNPKPLGDGFAQINQPEPHHAINR